MRILVTGGAGFVGSHYVRTLLTGGYPDCADATVTVLDKLTYAGNLANLDPVTGRFAFVHGDICDAALLAGVLPGHDVVVNFAAETHVDRSIAGAAEFVATNVSGVQVLLDVRVLMHDRGGKLVLARPQNTVARVLNLVGADQLIPVYPSVEEAIGTPLS